MTSAIWLLSFLLPTTPGAASTTAPASAIVVRAPRATISYVGFWLMQDQDAVVEITRQGDTYTGRLMAFRKSTTKEKLKLVNTILLKNLKADGDNLTGRIVDPSSGKDYKVTLIYTGPAMLEMQVKAMGVVVRKETWTRQASAK